MKSQHELRKRKLIDLHNSRGLTPEESQEIAQILSALSACGVASGLKCPTCNKPLILVTSRLLQCAWVSGCGSGPRIIAAGPQ